MRVLFNAQNLPNGGKLITNEILHKGKRINSEKWVEGFYSSSIELGDNGCAEHMYQETATRLHYIRSIDDGIIYMVYPQTVKMIKQCEKTD